MLKRPNRFNKNLFSLAALVVFINYADSMVSFNSNVPKDATQLRVLNWNLERFGELRNRKEVSDQIDVLVEKTKTEDPDVLILQEITLQQLKLFMERLGGSERAYKWSDYYGTGKSYHGGLAIVLNHEKTWTLKDKKVVNLPPQWKYIYTELENQGGQSINILGVHIAPPKLTEADLVDLSKSLLDQTDKETASKLKNKLSEYGRQVGLQNTQANKVIEIFQSFNDPTIIAGDFNSSPELPMHRKLRSNLTDAWLEAGNGLGATRYFGDIVPLRIDYVYASKEFSIVNCEVFPSQFSDHHGLLVEVYLEE